MVRPESRAKIPTPHRKGQNGRGPHAPSGCYLPALPPLRLTAQISKPRHRELQKFTKVIELRPKPPGSRAHTQTIRLQCFLEFPRDTESCLGSPP